jgi:hypothetical protein
MGPSDREQQQIISSMHIPASWLRHVCREEKRMAHETQQRRRERGESGD